MEDKSRLLGLGKVSPKVLQRTVIANLPMDESPGLDGGTVRLSGRTLISHSPSIGVPLEALGFFAFHYSVSNVAERFGKPRNLITGIYLPVNSTEMELDIITRILGEEARKYSVTVVAGQTSTYVGLEIPLITSTCIGEPTRKVMEPQPGDVVLFTGKVGREALWLKSVSLGETSEEWRNLTPLPVILHLQSVEGIRLMHDISEGGVKRALKEVASVYPHKIDIISNKVLYAKGIEVLEQDPLRAPTYGSLIVIASPECVNQVIDTCGELGVSCECVGFVAEGEGVYIDGEEVRDLDRMAIDWVYGSFEEQDDILIELRDSINQLVKIPEFNNLIPQVGSNMVYAKTGAESPDDVASIDGRIIPSRKGPRLCGDIMYSGSRFTSSVILEAYKVNPEMRAAISIRGGHDLSDALTKLGHRVKIISDVKSDVCLGTLTVVEADELYTVYYHLGAFGIEPTITIIGRKPSELLEIIQKLITHIQ